MTEKHYYSLAEFDTDCSILTKKIRTSGKIYTSVFGVPQGGVPLAVTLAYLLKLPLSTAEEPGCLVVDDIIDSGTTRRKYGAYDFATLIDKRNNIPSDDCISAKNTFKDKWVEFWWEGSESKSIEDSVVRQLQFLGEDVTREGLKDTPARVVESWKEIYAGYDMKVEDIITTFTNDGYVEIILLKDIEFYSTCEHHMQPFFGKAHVAYIPVEKVIGISKLARIVEMFSRRLQIQERISTQVVQTLMKELEPHGAACFIEAKHFCMCSRGVNKQNSVMTTSCLEGIFFDDDKARSELMSLLK